LSSDKAAGKRVRFADMPEIASEEQELYIRVLDAQAKLAAAREETRLFKWAEELRPRYNDESSRPLSDAQFKARVAARMQELEALSKPQTEKIEQVTRDKAARAAKDATLARKYARDPELFRGRFSAVGDAANRPSVSSTELAGVAQPRRSYHSQKFEKAEWELQRSVRKSKARIERVRVSCDKPAEEATTGVKLLESSKKTSRMSRVFDPLETFKLAEDTDGKASLNSSMSRVESEDESHLLQPSTELLAQWDSAHSVKAPKLAQQLEDEKFAVGHAIRKGAERDHKRFKFLTSNPKVLAKLQEMPKGTGQIKAPIYHGADLLEGITNPGEPDFTFDAPACHALLSGKGPAAMRKSYEHAQARLH